MKAKRHDPHRSRPRGWRTVGQLAVLATVASFGAFGLLYLADVAWAAYVPGSVFIAGTVIAGRCWSRQATALTRLRKRLDALVTHRVPHHAARAMGLSDSEREYVAGRFLGVPLRVGAPDWVWLAVPLPRLVPDLELLEDVRAPLAAMIVCSPAIRPSTRGSGSSRGRWWRGAPC